MMGLADGGVDGDAAPVAHSTVTYAIPA